MLKAFYVVLYAWTIAGQTPDSGMKVYATWDECNSVAVAFAAKHNMPKEKCKETSRSNYQRLVNMRVRFVSGPANPDSSRQHWSKSVE